MAAVLLWAVQCRCVPLRALPGGLLHHQRHDGHTTLVCVPEGQRARAASLREIPTKSPVLFREPPGPTGRAGQGGVQRLELAARRGLVIFAAAHQQRARTLHRFRLRRPRWSSASPRLVRQPHAQRNAARQQTPCRRCARTVRLLDANPSLMPNQWKPVPRSSRPAFRARRCSCRRSRPIDGRRPYVHPKPMARREPRHICPEPNHICAGRLNHQSILYPAGGLLRRRKRGRNQSELAGRGGRRSCCCGGSPPSPTPVSAYRLPQSPQPTRWCDAREYAHHAYRAART